MSYVYSELLKINIYAPMKWNDSFGSHCHVTANQLKRRKVEKKREKKNYIKYPNINFKCDETFEDNLSKISLYIMFLFKIIIVQDYKQMNI